MQDVYACIGILISCDPLTKICTYVNNVVKITLIPPCKALKEYIWTLSVYLVKVQVEICTNWGLSICIHINCIFTLQSGVQNNVRKLYM